MRVVAVGSAGHRNPHSPCREIADVVQHLVDVILSLARAVFGDDSFECLQGVSITFSNLQ